MAQISVRALCPELELKARIELNETPKKLEQGIIHLKEWIDKQPHLRARKDDQWLAAFLRGCKHSLEKAKEKLDLFYTMRSIAPDMTALKYWDPRFEELSKAGIGLVLPKRAHPADPRVVIVRASPYDPTKFTPPDFFAVTLVVQQITYMEDDAFVIAGNVIIFDFNGVNMGHLSQVTPGYIKKLVALGQDASPIRLKSAHFIGMPPYFQVLFNIGKQLLNEKNKQKIHMHNSFEDLNKYVSSDILPKEYGGNGGTVQEIIDYWMIKIAEYQPYLEEDMQYGTDENKRPGKPRTADSMLGVDGSFRRLDFD